MSKRAVIKTSALMMKTLASGANRPTKKIASIQTNSHEHPKKTAISHLQGEVILRQTGKEREAANTMPTIGQIMLIKTMTGEDPMSAPKGKISAKEGISSLQMIAVSMITDTAQLTNSKTTKPIVSQL